MVGKGAVRRTAIGLVMLLPACSHRREPPAEPPPVAVPTPTPAPTPPPPTINSGLTPEESLWHLRSALNVGALMCGGQAGGVALVKRYNALLVVDKAVLARAYASEAARFGPGQPDDLDRHTTQLYNFFAKPGWPPSFCAAAAAVAAEAAALPSGALTAYAPGALARLQDAVLAAPPMLPRMAMAEAVQPPPAAPVGEWRIQLGAFSGREAAQTAWLRIGAKLPALARYTPIFEAVPASPLVRVQIAAAPDRDGALRLCAAAAAGGFDCMAVGHR